MSRHAAVVALCAIAVAGAPSAQAAASDVHRVAIEGFMVGPTRAGARSTPPTGAQVEVKSLKFALGVDLLAEGGPYGGGTETVRLALPAGLSWGPAPADPRTLWPAGTPGPWSFTPISQGCTMTGQVAVCRAEADLGGTSLFGWLFDVVAAAPGAYTVTAEIVTPADGPNRPPRGLPGKTTLTVIVGSRSGPLVLGKPSLSRPKPSAIVLEAAVTQGGVLVRPTAATCAGGFPSDPSYERKTTHYVFRYLGKIRCGYVFNNARYLGQTLAGVISVRVSATKVSRTFSVRVGSGTTLSRPVGAVVSSKSKTGGTGKGK